MNKIEIKNLDLYYGDFHALKNINLEIPENQIDCKIWDIKKGVIFQVPADHQ